MPNTYALACDTLRAAPAVWLITGVAGFIGSNLLEALLKLDQKVVGMDNFSTGRARNLEEVRVRVSEQQWRAFRFHEGDIRDEAACQRAVTGVDYILHQAALGSVPRSLEDPISTHQVNIDGFLNMLDLARKKAVKRFVYAASSSTYGDHPALPKVEENIGNPLSPYAVTKYANELYADVYSRCYAFNSIGLRYFNVFGPRQDPFGAYAAVIPRWVAAMIRGERIIINGDGNTSRDFCFVENVVQANLLAAVMAKPVCSEIYNVALGDRTTLHELFDGIKRVLIECGVVYNQAPCYRDFRSGDVKHSQADISKAVGALGYRPTHTLLAGLHAAVPWYLANLDKLSEPR